MDTRLTLVHLYPGLLNLYGDRGNIIVLRRRAEWRGIGLRIEEVGLAEALPKGGADLIFMGGDQDREQSVVIEDLRSRHGAALRDMADEGVPILAVCGSYQLLQNFYRPAEGPELPGLGLINAYTIHPGSDVPRCVGNIAVEWEHGTIVGFENHGGRTYLQGDTEALGRVVKGFGNNGEDGGEGARVNNLFGTYVHGSLLPKNPAFADLLLEIALRRRYPDYELAPLDDSLETAAHRAALERISQ